VRLSGRVYRRSHNSGDLRPRGRSRTSYPIQHRRFSDTPLVFFGVVSYIRIRPKLLRLSVRNLAWNETMELALATVKYCRLRRPRTTPSFNRPTVTLNALPRLPNPRYPDSRPRPRPYLHRIRSWLAMHQVTTATSSATRVAWRDHVTCSTYKRASVSSASTRAQIETLSHNRKSASAA
jgi:hypothetical protein